MSPVRGLLRWGGQRLFEAPADVFRLDKLVWRVQDQEVVRGRSELSDEGLDEQAAPVVGELGYRILVVAGIEQRLFVR